MDCSAEISRHDKEPWFAACLSWLVPGIGQIYACKLSRGILFFLVAIAWYIIFIASLISKKFLIGIPLTIGIAGLLLQILIVIDAFKVAKKSNTNEFESKRTSGKDPWLSVFLSLLLPGLGHAYIRMMFFLVLYTLMFFVLEGLYARAAYIFIVLLLFRIWTCLHAYFATVRCWKFKKHIMVLFGILSAVFSADLTLSAVSTIFVATSAGMGSSMEPTLISGDRTFIERFTYLHFGNPKVGDIVMIRYPQGFQPPQYGNRHRYRPALEKRIVAAEGETVQVIGAKIFVNNVERKFGRIAVFGRIPDLDKNSKQAEIMKPYLKVAVSEPYVVPKGCYFVLGDNINNSIDSRYFGAFPKKDIMGKVVKTWWPPKRIRLLD